MFGLAFICHSKENVYIWYIFLYNKNCYLSNEWVVWKKFREFEKKTQKISRRCPGKKKTLLILSLREYNVVKNNKEI